VKERTLGVELLGRSIAFYFKLKEYPRPPYAHRDFEQRWLDLPKLGGYFAVPGTIN